MNAIYPGSFDPFHQGHLNIVKKASLLFDKIYVVVTNNVQKQASIDLDTRLKNTKEIVKELKNVEVIVNNDELSVEIAKKYNAKFIIRGLRNGTDFQAELEIYDANKYLDAEIETIYFISDLDQRKISSTYLKEIAYYQKLKKEKS